MAKDAENIAPRMFEFHEGSSDKFWCIELSGISHTVRYGRVGTDGQSKTKEFPDADKARASYDKLVDQKVKKGYAEVTDASQSRSEQVKASKEDAKNHEPFLKAILEDPDNLGSYAVYADWLQERSDPRGEFMSLQLQLEDDSVTTAQRKKLTKSEKDLLKQHRREWLGDLTPHLVDNKDKGKSEWRDLSYPHEFARGFLDSLSIGYLLPDFAKDLKRSAQARMLRRIVVRGVADGYDLMEEFGEDGGEEWDEDDSPGLRLLAGAKLENLRYFELAEGGGGTHIDGEGIEKLVRHMPRLEELRLEAHQVDTVVLFKIKFPHLRSLTVHHLTKYSLETLAKNRSLTQLETIDFFPHAFEYDDDEAYISLAGFRAICRSKTLPSLKHLTLYCSDIGDEGIEELVKSKLINQLKVLDLTYGSITDVGAATLAEADLSNFEKIDLSTNYLTKSGITALKEKCDQGNVSFVAKEQISGAPDDERQHLWYGDME